MRLRSLFVAILVGSGFAVMAPQSSALDSNGYGVVSVSSSGNFDNAGVVFGEVLGDFSVSESQVAFMSTATTLDPNYTAALTAAPSRQVYLHNLTTGTTYLISLTASGDLPASGTIVNGVLNFRLSRNGRYLAYWANNFIFVRDLQTGSVTTAGTSQQYAIDNLGDVFPDLPPNAVTPDGRFYLDNSGGSSYRVDRTNGERTLIAAAADGTPADRSSTGQDITPDGRYVAFASYADNLVPGSSSPCAPNLCENLFRKDVLTGAVLNVSGLVPGWYPDAAWSMTDDGRYISFCAQRLDGGAPPSVYVADGSTSVAHAVNQDLMTGPVAQHTFGCDSAVAPDGSAVYIAGENASTGHTTQLWREPIDVQSEQITTASGVSFTEGTWGSFTVSGSGMPVPSYGATGIPEWASFTSNGDGTATLTGTPPNGSAGDYPITITETSGTATATQSFTLSVAPPTTTGGETVTTDPGGGGATPQVPVQTAISVPAGIAGVVSVTPQPAGPAPSGFVLFGQEVVLTGPAASASTPYTISFTVDASALAGVAPEDVQIWRNGAQLTSCTDPTAATPDPCVASRGLASGGDGDALVTVRTSQFSTWTLGRPQYSFAGPFQPVDVFPTINTAKAGSAIPVNFSLGANRGLNVFANGYPVSRSVACGSAPSDAIEQTSTSTTSGLTYDTKSNRYSYVWKTDRTFMNCRDLVLRFRDGSVAAAQFLFSK